MGTARPAAAASPADPSGPVLLFDGECRLCRRLVVALARADAAGRLRFAPLQSPLARDWLRAHGLAATGYDSLVFIAAWPGHGPGGFALRSAGALAAAAVAGGGWRLFAWLRFVPPAARDPVYRLVARLRTAVFGRVAPGTPLDGVPSDRLLAS